jgi:elongation factor P
MDTETYEQFNVPKQQLGKGGDFLVDGMDVNALYQGDEFVTVELPTNVTLKVRSTIPPMKGEQSGSVEKEATLENNIKILVPLFIKEDNLIKVDTLTGQYIERVQEKLEEKK